MRDEVEVRHVGDALAIWTIYRSPSDHPGMWVVRPHYVPGGPARAHYVTSSLEDARRVVPPGLICLSRHEDDDPVIYETWI